MRLSDIAIRNFRRLEHVAIDVESRETIFVGPNNSGKTSATAIFRCFLDGRDFKVHDFSVARIKDFEAFAESGSADDLPEISLDLWFNIDPNSIAFGRVFSLLPKLSDFTRVGLRLTYGVTEAKKLREQYFSSYPADTEGKRSKGLFQFLAIDSNLNRYSSVRYFSLEEIENEDGTKGVKATKLEPEEGKKLVKHLVRVNFVDAQRNINDDDTSRSNKLSAAFASYYRKNLEQAAYAAAAHKVIDENNALLTAHYTTQFEPLIKLIKQLGVPSVNDRQLRLISALSPDTALRGNTELLYVDAERGHELPELYNGLGFKNLIYMAIQARHFHSQWIATSENRPLCHLIFIEEPEVHLHAQVQQTFISNIWKVIDESARAANQPGLVPQLVVTTHSSHILDTVDFEKVRYFQRCHLMGEDPSIGIRNASEVRSLRTFKPEAEVIEGDVIAPTEALEFLKRYLRLTHCDLFFTDGAILVEGAVEKLLMSSMIEKAAARLRSTYLTVLEVGGAFAHRFEGLLKFRHIPYLVITDLDSVVPAGRPRACRADTAGARTSNATLKKLCGKETVDELIEMQSTEKIHDERDRCVAFEIDVIVTDGDQQLSMRPRTLEEALVYENFGLVRTGKIPLGIEIPAQLADAYEKIYERVHSDSFKKTDFAMRILSLEDEWNAPAYIAEGLKWLEVRLCGEEPGAAPLGEGAQ